MSKQLPTFLQDDEPEKILKAAETERDRVLGMMLLMQGLRVAELCALRIEHLDFRKRLLWVREGKGQRDRCLPIAKALYGPLRGWVGGRKTGYVFPSRQGGGRLTTRTVQLLVKRLAKKAGLSLADVSRAISPHKFRHAFCSRLLEAGATVHEVQRLAGHQNVQTTSLYLHCMSDDRLRQALDKVY